MNWTLQIAFHYPHDRFLLGWEYMAFKNTTIQNPEPAPKIN